MLVGTFVLDELRRRLHDARCTLPARWDDDYKIVWNSQKNINFFFYYYTSNVIGMSKFVFNNLTSKCN